MRSTRSRAAFFQVCCAVAITTTAARAAAGSGDCNQPAPAAVTHVEVPGHPFAAVASADGCSVFVSLMARNGDSRIAVLARAGGVLSVERSVAAPGRLSGLALTRDGEVLVAANGTGIVFLSTERLVSGVDNAVLGALGDGGAVGSIYVAFGPEDRLLFVSDERAKRLSVYDFAGLLAGTTRRKLGEIPTGIAPVGLAFSPDGRWLYSTSEVGDGEPSCAAEQRGAAHAPGVLLVIDVERSAKAPADAVVARVPAGCNAVRVAVSPDGDRVYVTARGGNSVQVFDAGKLLTDRDHALTSTMAVGQSPVGIAVDGTHVFVANSDRFGGGQSQSISVLDTAHPDAPLRSIPAGGFPRELRFTQDGKSLLVTNFDSGTVELIDLERLGDLTRAEPDRQH